jgi:phosphoglycolate phosphatase
VVATHRDSPPRRRFDLVIFDLDGTLVDSAPDITWALNQTLAEAGYPTFTPAEVRERVGDGAGQLLARSVPRGTDAASLAPLVDRFISWYGDHLAVGTTVYPGIEALLERSRDMGIPMAVLTNKPSPLAHRLLAELGILGYFRHVIGDGDGFPRKPHPAAARHLAFQCSAGASEERVVVVGDGLPDVRMAHAVPCASVAVTWGYVPADRLLAESPTWMAASVAELSALL